MPSRIRKRPVSFGNPALGTYKGFVYTLEGGDDSDHDQNKNIRPLVEGAEAVERMVAMVDVPPEQVPEGILNLARSHRPYIEHVRIVIGEPDDDEEDEDGAVHTNNLLLLPVDEDLLVSTNTTTNNNSASQQLLMPSSVVSAMESAASILAEDELASQSDHGAAAALAPLTLGTTTPTTPAPVLLPEPLVQQPSLKWSLSDVAEEQRPHRSYLVLFHLLSEEDAEAMVEDLHGRPYTSLDETVTCSAHTVIALEGECGVSLLNPMFAPSTKKKKKHGSVEILHSASSGEEESSSSEKTSTIKTVAATTSNSNSHHLTEDPNCAVCLEHMSLDPGDGDKASILTTVCNHTFHLDCLIQCQDSPCPVCRYDHSGLNEALSQCHICGTTERNYVCLICGLVSCVSGTLASSTIHTRAYSRGEEDSCGGTSTNTNASSRAAAAANNNNNNRSSATLHHSQHSGDDPDTESSEVTAQHFYTSHANQHYDETLHAYALDTETQHVWDFAGQGYVHRLLQNKEDGKLVEVTDPNNTTSQERSLTPGLSDAQEGEVVHRKLEGFASQYYTLLKSQLEQQRTFYEGRLEEIRREFAIKKANATSDKADLMVVLKQEKKQLAHRLLSIKRKKDKVTEDVTFLKSMNESLESNKIPLERKIKQAQREQIESREMIQKYLPALEEKLTTLMLQLEESLNTTYTPSSAECAPDSS